MVTTVVVQTPNDGLTMSSREIAELVESRHDSVKRAIERLTDRGVIGLPPMVEYLDSLNRPALEYRLVKRDSYIIVAQLSPEFTARLVDRWQALESQLSNAPALPNFSDPVLAARAWADAKEAQQVAEAKVLQDAPKVAFHDAVVETGGTYRLDVVAKLIGTGISNDR